MQLRPHNHQQQPTRTTTITATTSTATTSTYKKVNGGCFHLQAYWVCRWNGNSPSPAQWHMHTFTCICWQMLSCTTNATLLPSWCCSWYPPASSDFVSPTYQSCRPFGNRSGVWQVDNNHLQSNTVTYIDNNRSRATTITYNTQQPLMCLVKLFLSCLINSRCWFIHILYLWNPTIKHHRCTHTHTHDMQATRGAFT